MTPSKRRRALVAAQLQAWRVREVAAVPWFLLGHGDTPTPVRGLPPGRIGLWPQSRAGGRSRPSTRTP